MYVCPCGMQHFAAPQLKSKVIRLIRIVTFEFLNVRELPTVIVFVAIVLSTLTGDGRNNKKIFPNAEKIFIKGTKVWKLLQHLHNQHFLVVQRAQWCDSDKDFNLKIF